MPGLAYFPRPSFPGPAFASGVVGMPGPDSVQQTADFSDGGIVGVEMHLEDDGLYISWEDTGANAAGSLYQVYVNGILKYEDVSTHFSLAGIGRPGDELTIHVGKVGLANRGRDYGPTLAPPPGTGRRAELTWIGGKWIAPDLVGYNVYASSAPGGPINLTKPVGNVPAHMGDEWGDGYGRGPFGRGPFGRGVVAYDWTSGVLAPGTWLFAVASLDATGGMPGAFPDVSVTIVGPPPAPKLVDGKRVRLASFDEATGSATIAWS